MSLFFVEGNESKLFLLYLFEETGSCLDALPTLDILGHSLAFLRVYAFYFKFCLQFVDPVSAILAVPAARVISFPLFDNWKQRLL